MADITPPDVAVFFADWVKLGRPLPLQVGQSGYDDTTLSWEVLYWDSPMDPTSGTGCSTPIAEFTMWHEAQDWARREAGKSTMLADNRRKLGPYSEYMQKHHDAWEAFVEGNGPRP